jgi:signal transduction histidine kinase
MFWVEADSGPWLAVSQATASAATGNRIYYARFGQDRLEKVIVDSLKARDSGEFAVQADVAGRSVIVGKTRAGRQQASGLFIDRSSDYPLAVTVCLADSSAYFAAHNRRQWLFSLLMIVAAATCAAAYGSAWRAFRHQVRVNEMKSNFVSSVSHELRAPIASVRLMAEGLERGKIAESDKRQEYYRFIVQECRRLSSLIENVLDFSRIEQGRKQYELEPANAVALAEQTVKLMQAYAEEPQIKISLQVTGEPVPVEMDSKAMQQALVNLIDNAIKHSPKGSKISVGVEFPHATSNTQHDPIRLWVEDHGEGIPPSEHEKIFERFYRLGSELRRETQGVGIGLSIVKHIVEAHGGKIIVRSAVGQGSRLTIELPVKGTGCHES